MCGNHSTDHDHHPPIALGPIGYRRARRLHRRAFLGYFGKGTAALAILGPVAAACGSSGSSAAPSITSTTSTPATSVAPAQSSTTTPDVGDVSSAPGASEVPAGVWGRSDLGFVSAYVLARGSELAIVDTGVSGSVDAIGATISDLGLSFSDVRHVVLTHYHGDHAGSIGAVLEAAPNAVGYAGELDLARIDADLSPLVDGDDVFGMQVVHTPGHTPGHVAIWDELTSTLVAGDAMNGSDGGVTGANPRFTPDLDAAAESVKKMAQLQFDNVYFGHGEPILGGASGAVMDLAAQL